MTNSDTLLSLLSRHDRLWAAYVTFVAGLLAFIGQSGSGLTFETNASIAAFMAIFIFLNGSALRGTLAYMDTEIQELRKVTPDAPQVKFFAGPLRPSSLALIVLFSHGLIAAFFFVELFS